MIRQRHSKFTPIEFQTAIAIKMDEQISGKKKTHIYRSLFRSLNFQLGTEKKEDC